MALIDFIAVLFVFVIMCFFAVRLSWAVASYFNMGPMALLLLSMALGAIAGLLTWAITTGM